MWPSLLNDVRRVLALFAGFVIGMHVAVFLHELGHALGYWLSGGSVTAIVMESPLPAGHVNGTAPNRFLPVWGGVVFGALIAVGPLLTARFLAPQSTIRFATMMSAAFCLGHNGMYLFVGSIIPFADASNMIGLGTPRWLLFLLGVPLLGGFVVVLTSAIQFVALVPAQSIWRRIIVVEFGLLTFPALMVGSMFFMPVPHAVRLPTITFVGCYGVCFGIAAYRVDALTATRNSDVESTNTSQNWSALVALILSAVVLILVEWLAFGAT